MITGFPDINTAISAINEGSVFYFISKPWKTEELTSMMHRLMEDKWHKKEHADMQQTFDDRKGCLFDRIYRIKLEYDNTRIPVADEEDIHLVYGRDILYLAADVGKVRVHTVHGVYKSRESLSSWSQKLGSSGFFRCHRSYIVNIERIVKISPWFNGAYNLKLKDCQDIIPVSRENVKTLKNLFGI